MGIKDCCKGSVHLVVLQVGEGCSIYINQFVVPFGPCYLFWF